MGIVILLLLVVAAVFFGIGFFGRGGPRYDMVSGGLFFAAIAWVLEHLPG